MIGSNQGIMWGMNGHPLSSDPVLYRSDVPLQYRMLNYMGLKHYRIDFYNPAEDQYQVLRAHLAAAKPFGIVVTPVLIEKQATTPGDAYTRGYNLGRGFALKFPDLVALELGNEQNNSLRDPFSDGSDPADFTSRPGWKLEAERMRGLVNGVRSASSKIRIALGDAGGCNYGFTRALYNYGLRWDITVIHPYHFWGPLENRGATGTHCRRGDNVIEKAAAYSKPIWMTEFNHTPGVSHRNKREMGAGLVTMMQEFTALAKKYRIESADIYELFDQPHQTGDDTFFGLFTPTAGATDATLPVRSYILSRPPIVYDQR